VTEVVTEVVTADVTTVVKGNAHGFSGSGGDGWVTVMRDGLHAFKYAGPTICQVCVREWGLHLSSELSSSSSGE
jgi:hypothetical protein